MTAYKPTRKKIKLWKALARKGEAKAQFALGSISQDYKEAVKWYRRAADQGLAGAQYGLGFCYLNGMGVEEDSTKGISLMQSAVEKEPKLQEEFDKVLADLDSEPEDKPDKEAEERDTVSNVVPLHPVTKRSVIPGPVSEDIIAQVMRSMSIEVIQKTRPDLAEGLKQIGVNIFFDRYPYDKRSVEDILQILRDQDEGVTLEVKATFETPTNPNQPKGNNDIKKSIQHASLKNIAALLNTEGGVLCVGITDDKNVTGIELDGFNAESKKSHANTHDKDSYKKLLSTKIRAALSDKVSAFYRIDFEKHEDVTVCFVHCKRSPHPIYLKWACSSVKDEEEFYVRDNGEAVKKKGEALTTYLAHRF